jgi:hypothetical protein
MPKTITVHLEVDGTPKCLPIVTRVRPGGTLVWEGKTHSGSFDGRIPGPPKDTFTPAEFHALHPVAGPMPFQPLAWGIADETPGANNPSTVHVAPDAEPGAMYKYTITSGGRILDPIIIIDPTAQED